MSSKKLYKNKKNQKTIANKRIKRLFKLAQQNSLSKNLYLSDKYIKLARKISMRYLVTIPKEYKNQFCKHCYNYLLPDITGRIRIHRGKIIIFCYKCNKYSRIPLKNR